MVISCLDIEVITYMILEQNLCGIMGKTVILSEQCMLDGNVKQCAEVMRDEK